MPSVTSRYHVASLTNLGVFSCRHKHSRRGKWFFAQWLGKIKTARAPAENKFFKGMIGV